MIPSIERRIRDPEVYWKEERYRKAGEKAMILERLKWLKEKTQ